MRKLKSKKREKGSDKECSHQSCTSPTSPVRDRPDNTTHSRHLGVKKSNLPLVECTCTKAELSAGGGKQSTFFRSSFCGLSNANLRRQSQGSKFVINMRWRNKRILLFFALVWALCIVYYLYKTDNGEVGGKGRYKSRYGLMGGWSAGPFVWWVGQTSPPLFTV